MSLVLIKLSSCVCLGQALCIEHTRRVSFDIKQPGKALRMLVDIVRLAKRFNMHSQSPAWSTRYIKTRTRYSIYQFTHCFSL